MGLTKMRRILTAALCLFAMGLSIPAAWAAVESAQVSCAVTPTLLLPASHEYLGWKLTNTSTTTTIYIGNSAVTTTTGDAFLPGTYISDKGSKSSGRDTAIGEAIYCVVASGTVVATRLTITD